MLGILYSGMLGRGKTAMLDIRHNLPTMFPATGEMMRPTNALLMRPFAVRPSIELTRDAVVTPRAYFARSSISNQVGQDSEASADHSYDTK